MRAQVKEKREVAKGTLLVVFDLLGREVDFRPGQYFWVTLLDPPYDDEKGPRQRIQALAGRAAGRRRGRGRGAEGGVGTPRGDRPAVRLRRRRDRDHRLS